MRESLREILAGIAVENRVLRPLIRRLSDLQKKIIGMRLF